MRTASRRTSGRTGPDPPTCPHTPHLHLRVIESRKRAAAFVRGFFTFLASRNIQTAVLHGGADGFEHDLSDVDFAVDRRSFHQLAGLIDDYCSRSGWLLCQILRHETTAAYFVCSAADDPACAVALDACSDYQRNGTVFLAAETLLENRQPLAWGGHGLSPATELRYRFAKAAAKNKDTVGAAREFANYPDEIRRNCEAWLRERWGIALGGWDSVGLATAFSEFRRHSNSCPPLLESGSLTRIASRILHPTGLIVVTGRDDFESGAIRLNPIFGHLYFRRFRKADRWRPAMIKDLIASTLIVVPQLKLPWSKLLPTECIHRLDPAHDPDTQCQKVAEHLHQRCKQRENR